jgi:hypothetical protein
MADRDPTHTVDKIGERHFSQMAWINKAYDKHRRAGYAIKLRTLSTSDTPDSPFRELGEMSPHKRARV